MIGIGTILYRFDENRRVYKRDENNRPYGGAIYAEHFVPVEIHGETKLSWICGPSYAISKVNKKEIMTGRSGDFFTAEGMNDQIWIEDHRHRVRDRLYSATADQLRQIAAILGYKP